MLVSIHELRDQNSDIVSTKTELVDEALYDNLKKKKEKLIQQIKNEKIIDPSLQESADKAVASIKKDKCGYGKVGRVQYFYEGLKGLYFYIHKIVEQDGVYIDSVRFYCSRPDTSMFDSCQIEDRLFH